MTEHAPESKRIQELREKLLTLVRFSLAAGRHDGAEDRAIMREELKRMTQQYGALNVAWVLEELLEENRKNGGRSC